MAPKKKKPVAKPKNQKETIVQSAQNAIQERLQKTVQPHPSKPDAPANSDQGHATDSDSSDDEDFIPEVQQADSDPSSSEDDAETTTPGASKPKIKRRRDDDEVDVELASGDEGVIQQRTRKKHKTGGDTEFLSDDEGGDAGFIKTRAQRRTEQQERRPLAQLGNATADIDSIWARLAALPVGRPPEPPEPRSIGDENDFIIIQRKTKFAGQVTMEQRRVLKNSQEAKIYLAEQQANKKQQQRQQEAELAETAAQNKGAESDASAQHPLRRPLFRKSRFEPNPTGEVKTLPPHLQLTWPREKSTKTIAIEEHTLYNPRALPTLTSAAKLNTVQKSKYDWAGYVDKAGIAEELDQYGKSKQSYAEKTGFLNRLEGRKEEERLAAKRKVA